MTPERLAEIREICKQRIVGADIGDVAVMAVCAKELLTAYDSIAAKVDRLKGEVEGWKADAERHCRNEIYYTGLLDEIAKNFGRAAYTSDDGSIQQDPLRAKMPELVATLRTQLDALVTAGTLAARALENIVDKKVGEWDDWETAMRESYPEYLRDVRGQAKQGLDALSAALAAAKAER